ncbi:GNAT family N-acetyltransferase [Halosquirtibacter laminarini]|uniref:GNAT family N-acetyltransferase n=1 Tax=Halosquirtibacter laminarini TaxID=3374600 RepID=A0AC61NC25_9BACT|nr:GNAT family N-acetyltransferase [Prolixibacteraceae bacterium]
MSIEIKEVSSKKDIKKFIKFYTDLYKENKQVAFPLHLDEQKCLSDENPALSFCRVKYFLAWKQNKIVGRICAIINTREQKKINKKIGRFGLFDFIDDKNVSHLLMEKACEWLKSEGVDIVHGPMGFTDMDRQGLLIEGHDRDGTMATNYNFPYYEMHIDALEFSKSTDWIEFLLYPEEKVLSRIGKLSSRCKKIHNLRSVYFSSRRELKKHADEIFSLINDSYKDLYGYIELDEAQKKYYTKTYLSFVNLKMIGVVMDHNDKIVGVGISMPSFTKALQKARGKLFPMGVFHMFRALKKNDCADLYLIAVDKEYQGKGVNAIIMHDITKGAFDLGITKAETNIELEDNKKIHQMWRFFNGEQHKRRRCYIKSL